MSINKSHGEVSRCESPHLVAIMQSMLVTFYTRVLCQLKFYQVTLHVNFHPDITQWSIQTWISRNINMHTAWQKRNVNIEKVQNLMLIPFKLVAAASNTVTESDYPNK